MMIKDVMLYSFSVRAIESGAGRILRDAPNTGAYRLGKLALLCHYPGATARLAVALVNVTLQDTVSVE